MTSRRVGALALGCALVGCASDGAPKDDSGVPDVVCDAVSVTMTGEWEKEDLPEYAYVSHTPSGVALGDLDGDGWMDGLLAFGGGAMGLRNDGTGALTLEPDWGMDGGPLPPATAAALADLDDDGDLDAYLGRDRDEYDVILTNDGTGHFTSTPLPNSQGAGSTGAFADFDGDGDLDLFVARTTTDTEIKVVKGGIVGDGCQLFLQQDDGTFADATERLPSELLFGWTFQASPIDADGDGDLDLYFANDFGNWLIPNALLLNDGNANFAEAEDCYCDVAMFGMGAAVGDANADGTPDLYVTDVGGPNLFANDGSGAFYDATEALGAAIPAAEESLTSWGTAFVDLDQDTFEDLVVTFGQLGQPDTIDAIDEGAGWVDGEEQPDQVLFGGPEGFEHIDVGWNDPSRTRAVAVGDLDQDGRPDLVSAGKYFLRAWHTAGGCDPGVQVRLDSGGRNHEGIGARVVLESGGKTQTKWMLPSTTGSSSAAELYFGMTTETGTLTVTWPDGQETVTEVSRGPVEITR